MTRAEISRLVKRFSQDTSCAETAIEQIHCVLTDRNVAQITQELLSSPRLLFNTRYHDKLRVMLQSKCQLPNATVLHINPMMNSSDPVATAQRYVQIAKRDGTQLDITGALAYFRAWTMHPSSSKLLNQRRQDVIEYLESVEDEVSRMNAILELATSSGTVLEQQIRSVDKPKSNRKM